jgi:hypothetical protein
MARSDMAGLWWDDTPPPKPPKKEKEKRTPPEPVWLRPDYLPGLEEARAMRGDVFTDAELVAASLAKDRLVWDIECYPNYFLVAFKSISSEKVTWFESAPDLDIYLDIPKLQWVLQNFTLVDYNGDNYDVPIVSLAIDGKWPEHLYDATSMIINQGMRPQDVLKLFKTKRLQVDHIDLIELIALSPSLKLLAGRIGAPRMQDLPFAPGTVLSKDQITITRWYCVNDLDNTKLLYSHYDLLPDIQLREKMSERYGIDLRSHSDPQIAEAVISATIKQMTGRKYLTKPKIEPGTTYKYQTPWFVKYQTPLMNWVLETVQAASFVVSDDGNIGMPKELKDLKIQIGEGVYRMGIGGLHSSEKVAAHVADENTILSDRDVASYYPRIILNCGLAPKHLGQPFLVVYNGLVEERLEAKRTGNKTAADGGKIVVNGSFGKLGSMYSILYAPDLLIQVTVTGQLAILMLIEKLELAGIPVVSANTDGIVIKCPASREADMNAIVAQWEKDTGFETEENRYRALYSRDVNNYFAVKMDGKCKVKGVYSEKGSNKNTVLSKNPMVQVCSDAVQKLLTTGIPIAETISACKDIRRFVSVRTVRGGAVKDGEYLGKAIRWYYATGVDGEIVYAKSGNKVPRSEGAKPLMQLPVELPSDIDYSWYEKEANKYLVEIGYTRGEVVAEELTEEM